MVYFIICQPKNPWFLDCGMNGVQLKMSASYYLPKDGYTTLVIGFVRLNGSKLILPFSNSFKKTHKAVEITIPPVLLDKKVREIRILPKVNARFFGIKYI